MLSYAQSPSNDPPEILVEGDQFYCPISEINVVTEFDITNPSEVIIDAFFIQISSGYERGSDVLKLGIDQENIKDTWNDITGKLSLTSKNGDPLELEDIIAAVKDVVFFSRNETFSGERYFSFTIGDANFLPSTGHYYEFIDDVGITWQQARVNAELLDYYGLPGYLATITSREEAKLSGEQADGAGWIGGSDAAIEGTWEWVTGPEQGDVFWIGAENGYAPNGAFEFWNNNEPNNLGGEDYAHVTAPGVGILGSWNDLSNTGGGTGNYQPKGFIVEYGFGGPDDAPNFSGFSRIFTNAIDSVFNGSRCGPGQVELRATLDIIEDQPTDSEILWFETETSLVPVHRGGTYIPDLISTEHFYVIASQNDCVSGERKIILAGIFDIPDINKEATLKNCDQDDDPGDGYTDFNLEEANELIIKINNKAKSLVKSAWPPPLPTDPIYITYHLSQEDAEASLNALDPFPFNNKTADMVFARVENKYGCFDIAEVFLEVSATEPVDVVMLESCDYEDLNDGYYSFDLTEASTAILAQLPPQNLKVQYYRNLDDAVLEQNEIIPQNDYKNEEAFFQSLFVRIESEDNGDCISLGEFLELYVYPLPEFQVNPEAVYCTNLEPVELSVFDAQDVYSYEWKDASGLILGTGESIMVSEGGQFTVTATSDLGCESKQRVINVLESSIATVSQDDIEVIDGGEENSIQIDPTNLGIGNYEYALGNEFGPYQNEPYFENVIPGIHTLYIRDKNGCGTAEIEISIIGYPNFFTPNDDGYNDTWQVQGVSFQPKSNIYIYDKFGKLLAQLDAQDEGWYGLYKGNPLPSADYWYRVQLQDGRIHTGHFSLIRR